jgi:hypothetical protein
MGTIAACASCGVVECETAFHACLAADFSDARYGMVHHLVVATYGLQHGWYTDEATPGIVDFVLAHLDDPPTDGDRRAIRVATDGPVQVRRRSPHPLPIEWKLTVDHVDRESARAYVATVRAWAASVAEALRGVWLRGG